MLRTKKYANIAGVTQKYILRVAREKQIRHGDPLIILNIYSIISVE